MESPAFEHKEFEHRLARAQQAMRAHGLDAIVVTSPHNFRYFTGFDSQFWESPTRPWFAIVPGEGSTCIAVVPEIGRPVLADGWVSDIRSWQAPCPADDGVSLLAGALQPLARRFKRIGMEMGREMSLRMPLVDFFALRERLAGVELADGTPCIWELRSIKSDAEVAYLRQGCQLVSDAFEALPGYAAVGRTEREICTDLTIDILRRGAHTVPFVASASGPGGYPQIISRPGARVIRDGDVLIVDVGATVHGYSTDFDRNYGFGKVPDAALRAHEVVWQATEAGIAAAVPGARACDLHAAMTRVLEAAGMLGNNVGRLGHGLGLQLTEPPSHKPGDETVLRPGMVITIEPGMEYAPGKMIVHEEDVHITDSGAVLLTRRAPREMPVIG